MDNDFNKLGEFRITDLIGKEVTAKMSNGDLVTGKLVFYGTKDKNIKLDDYKLVILNGDISEGSQAFINGYSWQALYLE
jgi:small nuclear ribonucleoprotein (snRNP)-like protein